jgi:hypothetical protein
MGTIQVIPGDPGHLIVQFHYSAERVAAIRAAFPALFPFRSNLCLLAIAVIAYRRGKTGKAHVIIDVPYYLQH